jgi:hypothetical protein
MNIHWIQSINWVAFLCYAVPLLIYISEIYNYIDSNDMLRVFNYSLLACAFLAFSVYTFENSIKYTVTPQEIESPKSLYSSPARLGYIIMTVSIVISIFLSWYNGEPLYFQRLIGVAAYVTLAAKVDIGILLMIVFYVFSLFYATKTSSKDILYALSKFGLILYFGTYGYRVFTNDTKIGKKLKDKIE